MEEGSSESDTEILPSVPRTTTPHTEVKLAYLGQLRLEHVCAQADRPWTQTGAYILFRTNFAYTSYVKRSISLLFNINISFQEHVQQ